MSTVAQRGPSDVARAVVGEASGEVPRLEEVVDERGEDRVEGVWTGTAARPSWL